MLLKDLNNTVPLPSFKFQKSTPTWKETKKIDFGSETDAVSEEAKAWKTIWSSPN